MPRLPVVDLRAPAVRAGDGQHDAGQPRAVARRDRAREATPRFLRAGHRGGQPRHAQPHARLHDTTPPDRGGGPDHDLPDGSSGGDQAGRGRFGGGTGGACGRSSGASGGAQPSSRRASARRGATTDGQDGLEPQRRADHDRVGLAAAAAHAEAGPAVPVVRRLAGAAAAAAAAEGSRLLREDDAQRGGAPGCRAGREARHGLRRPAGAAPRARPRHPPSAGGAPRAPSGRGARRGATARARGPRPRRRG